jgi:Aldose 1-epimerase
MRSRSSATAGCDRAPCCGGARRVDWELAEAHEGGDDVVLAFRLADTSATRSSAWPHRFDARYTVTVGSRLTLSLQVTNLDPGTVTVEEAFHTYLRVADIHATEVTGLEGAETDRIDLGTRAAATVVDGAARSCRTPGVPSPRSWQRPTDPPRRGMLTRTIRCPLTWDDLPCDGQSDQTERASDKG